MWRNLVSVWRTAKRAWRTAKRVVLGWWRWLGAWLTRLKPRGPIRRGVGWGATIAVFVLGIVFGITVHSQLGRLVDPFLGVGLAALFLLGGYLGVRLLMWLLLHLRGFLGALGVAALLVLAALLVEMFEPPLALPLSLGLVVLGAALGSSIAALGAGVAKGTVWIPLSIGAVVVAATASLVLWLRGDGSSEHLISIEDPVSELVPLLELEDPSIPGRYAVRFFTYGSGEDLRREVFREVDVVTEPVDATPYTDGYKDGWRQKLRNRFWGFEPEAYPRNGRVWAPEGDGPFPLVLIVHGNHNMGEFSDPGYEYLGRHLASRGMILVSVDENFLNGSAVGGVPTENDARAWVLLQHLALWRQWQAEPDPQNPLAEIADLGRIALIGHSRGGEAAAIAAFFNRLGHYPDDATEVFGFAFDIRGVIAIAPSDGQYRPGDRRATLEDVSYFVIQGGHDADVSLFMGDRQWERVSFSENSDAFKASLYAYRANHGQFNTAWGRTDFSMPMSWLLNLEPLHSGEDQRRLGKVFMTAFLEIVLHDRREYLPLFRDPRAARHWLPEDLYLSRYEDASFRLLADFEEDLDVTTTSVAGGRIESTALTLWREGDLKLRRGSARANHVAMLGWKREPEEGGKSENESEKVTADGEAGESGPSAPESVAVPAAPSYRIDLPEGLAGAWSLDAGDRLVFSLAALDESAPDPDSEEGEEEEGEGSGEGDEDKGEDEEEEADEEEADEEEADPEPLDLTIELIFDPDHSLRTRLSQHRLLLPPLPIRFSRLDGVEEDRYGTKAEPVLQTFELPLKAFEPEAATPSEVAGVDWSSLAAIRLVFDRSATGVVALDRLGFSLGPPAERPP